MHGWGNQSDWFYNTLIVTGSASVITEDMLKYQQATKSTFTKDSIVTCHYCRVSQPFDSGKCAGCGAPLPKGE